MGQTKEQQGDNERDKKREDEKDHDHNGPRDNEGRKQNEVGGKKGQMEWTDKRRHDSERAKKGRVMTNAF